MLGGDHSLSLPTLRVLAERHGPDGYAVLHLDTHADTADQLYGVRVSHGTPFRVPRAYLSVDIDVLDPAFTPGTGTPEPGGLTTRELLWTVRPVREGGRIGALEKRTERSELSRALNRDARERGR